MKSVTTLIVVGLLAAAGHALAQDKSVNKPASQRTTNAPAPDTEMTEGEVRKVDKAAKKITLKHGPIKNLDMPPMTMVFQVQNPALLDLVKAGDKVKFTAADINGALVVIDLQPVK